MTNLNAFTNWINHYCAERSRIDDIPDVNGGPWRLTTPQFRRTLAWFIARAPRRPITGAIAYRHLSIQMFEGYAGTSDSGFRGEVGSSRPLALANLLAMIDQHEHTNFAGPRGRRGGASRVRSARPLLRHSDHRKRRKLLALMASNDPTIYPNKYVTCCVHTHATTLCCATRPARRAPAISRQLQTATHQRRA